MMTLASIWSLGTVAFTGFFAMAFAFFFFVVIPLRVVFSSSGRSHRAVSERSSRDLTAEIVPS